jgi:4-amino-4-deoxy-L-arabinose transferase-like glycosyltransferase
VTSRAGEPAGVPAAGSAGGSVPQRGTSQLFSAGVAAVFFAFCLLVQYFSGAWSASFDAYPDEPAHFVGAVMFREWLVSGRWFPPFEFAKSYYAQYPFFAVGFWPPLFSIVTGCWMLIAGVGRLQALLIPAVFAAATGWLIFQLVRVRAGIFAALCAGTLYLSLPVVRHWMCAVMVDHMTAFLCLASAACFLRYLEHPGLSNGILCGVIFACAILSKYSAVYIVVVPFAAVLVLRRFELLKRASLLVQPLIVGLIVGPWALWTRGLAYYGLSSEPPAVTANRAAMFVLETFKIFPPVLMAVVVLGLIALLFRPRAWREDVVVLGILCAGHLTLLILSPVDAEQRYLLAPAVVFLVASFAGWFEVLALMPRGGRWVSAIPVFVGILTIVFVVLQFSNFARAPKDRVENVVASIVKDPARASQRIVVPPNLEGPVIAEFALQSPQPNFYLLRPSKILAHSDWLGFNYSSVFSTSAEMMEYFRQHPVNLIMWNDLSQSTPKAHAQIMSEMLQRYPLLWHKVQSVDSASWTIYEYNAQSQEMR